MPNVEFERRDGAALVTLSRPERLNAVTPALVEELHRILDELMVDTETRVVVLTGRAADPRGQSSCCAQAFSRAVA